ncbi:MAG: inositol monophosphatase family protein [Hyphomicrobiales bacterium]
MSGKPDTVPLEFLHELADAADGALRRYFRTGVAVANKEENGFDPVTKADREAEKAIRALIEVRYPEHGIVGEEFGNKDASSGGQPVWVLDPLDGTKAFITGMLNWMTLIGLNSSSGAVAGMASQGFTRERFFAGAGESKSWYRGPGGETAQLKTSGMSAIEEASFCTTVPDLFTGVLNAPYEELKSRAKFARFSGDAYFFCMVAAGHIDIAIDPGLNSYDIAALVPIVENAGGVVTTLGGEPAHNGGDIVAAATPQLHEEVLKLFSQ